MFYVGFKDNPEEFAYFAELHCTKEGKITKKEIFENPTWENTADANLMHFLHSQVSVISRIHEAVQTGFQSGLEGPKNVQKKLPLSVMNLNNLCGTIKEQYFLQKVTI